MAKKSKPGDGKPLRPYRWWQLFSRALFHIRLSDIDGTSHRWSVDVALWGDSDGEVVARLFRDDVNEASSKLPAAFDVPGGTIEVAASNFGLKRCHFVDADGVVRQLAPDPASAEGRRARLDRDDRGISRLISVISVIVLVIAVVLGVPQLVEEVSRIPWIADNLGVFVSPVHLPAWFNVSLFVATLVASTERALRLRYHWLLDGGLFEGED